MKPIQVKMANRSHYPDDFGSIEALAQPVVKGSDVWEVWLDTEYGCIFRYSYKRGLTKREAKRLERRVNKQQTFDMFYWEHYRTVYGSKAYVERDVEAQLAEFERRDETYNYWKAM